MIIFSVASYLLFGLIIGAMVAFMMERRAHTAEHVVAGIGGAFFGGMVGLILGQLMPAMALNVSGYSVTALVLALGCSAAFTVFERSWHKRGRMIFNDPRPTAP